jgi:hypothetical protein
LCSVYVESFLQCFQRIAQRLLILDCLSHRSFLLQVRDESAVNALSCAYCEQQ